LAKDSFYYKPAKEAHGRILSLLKSRGTLPDWSEICNDPAVSESTRNVLKASDEKAIRSYKKTRIDGLLNTLERYRQLRGMLSIADTTLKKLEDENVDLDVLMDEASSKLADVRVQRQATESIVHFGKGNNAGKVMKDLLRGKRKAFVPTGFRAFDKRNGGFHYGSLVVIGANTGGGKSALANQLLVNMTSMYAEDCCIVPLEMNATEMSARIIGCQTGLEVSKIAQKKLSKDEEKIAIKAYARFVNGLKANETRYSIYVPEQDMSLEEILLVVKPYRYRVVIIDYISLLKGVDGDDQWRKLGAVARFAKIYAKTTNTIVILLVQLSKDGELKYSKTIAEHANNAWFFVNNGTPGEETTIWDIRQIKARNQQLFNFQLLSHNLCMKITDVEEGHGEQESESNDKKKKGSDEEYLSDLNEASESDDDDDDEEEGDDE
jgi:replicative DNA helicase